MNECVNLSTVFPGTIRYCLSVTEAVDGHLCVALFFKESSLHLIFVLTAFILSNNDRKCLLLNLRLAASCIVTFCSKMYVVDCSTPYFTEDFQPMTIVLSIILRPLK